MLSLSDYFLTAGLVFDLHLIVAVDKEVVLEKQVLEREKECLHQHAQGGNRVVLRVEDHLRLHVERLKGRSHQVVIMRLTVF